MAYKLVVFDLDFTLWNAGGTWCDHTSPPYRRVNNHVCDSEDSIILLYPGVKETLERLYQKYSLAVASRTHCPDWAIELMQLFGIRAYFDYLEIYPGSKIKHFRQLQHTTKIDFDEMMFFDDEMRNVDEVAELGVETVLVSEGLSPEIVKSHL